MPADIGEFPRKTENGYCNEASYANLCHDHVQRKSTQTLPFAVVSLLPTFLTADFVMIRFTTATARSNAFMDTAEGSIAYDVTLRSTAHDHRLRAGTIAPSRPGTIADTTPMLMVSLQMQEVLLMERGCLPTRRAEPSSAPAGLLRKLLCPCSFLPQQMFATPSRSQILLCPEYPA